MEIISTSNERVREKIGVHEAIACDASEEKFSKEVKTFCNSIGVLLKYLEEETPHENLAESHTGVIKESVSKDMTLSNRPLVFWDCCAERRERLNNLTATNVFQLYNSNSCSSLSGKEGGMSNL